MMQKRVFFAATVLGFIFFCYSAAFCAENYYIENRRVLLYKIINWWYDCLPDESNDLCDSLVTYKRRGDIIVEHNDKSSLVFNAEGGFAAQLSIPDLKCIWADRAYFGDGKPGDITSAELLAGQITMGEIEVRLYRRIRDSLQYLSFELEGRIVGLLDGQIAMQRAGQLIKTCPVSTSGKVPGASFKIVNSLTGKVIAAYAARSLGI